MAEYSRLFSGSFTSTGALKMINLPAKPDYVEFWNYTAMATPAEHGIPRAVWFSGMGDGKALVDLFNATPVLITDSVEANGIYTFEANASLQFEARKQVVSITKADPAVVTVTGHGYTTGDVVLFQGLYQSATTGMAQICNIPFVVTVTGANTFTIKWNTNQSNYTALSTSPTGAFVKKIKYPFLYAPGVSIIEGLTLGASTVVDTTAPHNLVVGQEVAFRIPNVYGTVELNSLPNVLVPGQPVYGYVTAVGSSTQVTVAVNSASFTAFNTNQPISSVPGLQLPQLVAVGTVNSGSRAPTATELYPPPLVNGAPTIGGPATEGAFVANTRAGFVIGAGFAAGDTDSVLVGANNDVIYWKATVSDANF